MLTDHMEKQERYTTYTNQVSLQVLTHTYQHDKASERAGPLN